MAINAASAAKSNATDLSTSPRANGHPSPDDRPSSDVVDFLSNHITYDVPLGRVERIETHISWIFLTPRHVYKLKKPVRFDFLDFSTLERRRKACEDEVRLNRRLAPHVYLSVVPVVRDARGQLHLGGSEEVVDWVVKMRRLPADRALDCLIQNERLAPFEIQQLGGMLTRFYLSLPPVTLETEKYRARLQHHVDDNYRELSDPRHTLSPQLVQRIHAAQQAYLLLYPQQFDDRVCDGRIVEGHGDLRPEHVYLNAGPKVIDCVEFNLEYRQLDVADELSFLAMECALLGRESLGDVLLNMYCEASGDEPPKALCGFYASYRASVRAKVATLRAEQLGGEPREAQLHVAQRYLELADRYSRLLGPPLLLLVRGLSGTGKSTLATTLAERFRLTCLRTDIVRREMFATESVSGPPNETPYDPDNRQLVYDRLLTLAEDQLRDHGGVVLDGTFLTTAGQQRAIELAERHGALPLIIECHCPEDVAHERIAVRQARGDSVSDAYPELVSKQREQEKPAPPGAKLCRIETTSSLPQMLQRVVKSLRSSVDGK